MLRQEGGLEDRAGREDVVVEGAKGQGIESIFLAFPPPSHCPLAASCTSCTLCTSLRDGGSLVPSRLLLLGCDLTSSGL